MSRIKEWIQDHFAFLFILGAVLFFQIGLMYLFARPYPEATREHRKEKNP